MSRGTKRNVSRQELKDQCLKGKEIYPKKTGDCFQWTSKSQCSLEGAKCRFKYDLEIKAKGPRTSTRSPSPSRTPRWNSTGKRSTIQREPLQQHLYVPRTDLAVPPCLRLHLRWSPTSHDVSRSALAADAKRMWAGGVRRHRERKDWTSNSVKGAALFRLRLRTLRRELELREVGSWTTAGRLTALTRCKCNKARRQTKRNAQ